MTSKQQAQQQHPTYIILGSGGHTAEMLKINDALIKCNNIDYAQLYAPVRYLVARTDVTSRIKLLTASETATANDQHNEFIEIPRSREVGQNWLTTIFTTFWALIWSFWLVWRDRPRLVLCNGPGTCVPICFAAFIWRLLGRLPKNSKIIFIESFCRVQTLSLSGRLLMPFVDALIVQWQELADKYKTKSNVMFFGNFI